MKKSAFLSDVFFTFFGVSLFTLCLFRYLKIGLTPALLLSAVCGILASASVFALLQSKRHSFYLKKSDEALKNKLLLHLSLLSDEQKTLFFQKVLSKSEKTERFGKLRLYSENAFYFLHFRFAPVTADEAANAARWKTSKRKILLCEKIEEEAALLCQKLGVEIVTGDGVYALVKTHEGMPEKFLGEELPENKRKRRLRICFAKSNGKRFFFGGALILLTSLITPFPYYYLLFGSVLLLASLFIRIFGYA